MPLLSIQDVKAITKSLPLVHKSKVFRNLERGLLQCISYVIGHYLLYFNDIEILSFKFIECTNKGFEIVSTYKSMIHIHVGFPRIKTILPVENKISATGFYVYPRHQHWSYYTTIWWVFHLCQIWLAGVKKSITYPERLIKSDKPHPTACYFLGTFFLFTSDLFFAKRFLSKSLLGILLFCIVL